MSRNSRFLKGKFYNKQCHNVDKDRSCNVDQDIVRGERVYFFPKRSYRLWGPPIPLFSWYRRPFPGVKRAGREVRYSRPSSSCNTDVKNEWSYTSSPPMCLCGMDRENFTLTWWCQILIVAPPEGQNSRRHIGMIEGSGGRSYWRVAYSKVL